MKTLEFFENVQNILSFFLMFYSVYNIVIWLFVYAKPIKKKKIIKKKHKIMAVISARNEEAVIGNLIESLNNQVYPKNKFDIYVIADNCTDSTAKVARNAGAIVYERFNEFKRSKGYALEWFFDIVLKEFPDKYDAFCIFDADNIVAPNFISKMNEKLCEGETVVQGYRDIKNPGDNWVSGNYAIFYWTMDRCYHSTRDKLGLSPLINGTGFMIAMSVLKEEGGWHTETLTEDTETSMNMIAKGRRIAWANDAVIYDEQPTDFVEAWNQRLRWGVGTAQCLKACLPKMIKSKHMSPQLIDGIIYLMGMPLILFSVLITGIDLLKFLLIPTKQGLALIQGKLFFVLAFATLSILHALWIVWLEKKDVKKVWKGIVTYPIFLIVSYFVNFAAFFNMKLQWKQIKHESVVSIDDIVK